MNLFITIPLLTWITITFITEAALKAEQIVVHIFVYL